MSRFGEFKESGIRINEALRLLDSNDCFLSWVNKRRYVGIYSSPCSSSHFYLHSATKK